MRAAALLWLIAASTPAFCHELITSHGSFLGPALHAFTELDHVIAFAVVGLLAGQNEGCTRMSAIVVFAVALLAAIVASVALPGLAAVGPVERVAGAAAALLAGILVAVDMRLSVWPIAIVSAALGLVHGTANGLALQDSPRLPLSVLGAGIAALAIALAGTLVAAALRGPGGRIAVRVLGSWVAALSLMLIGLDVRG